MRLIWFAAALALPALAQMPAVSGARMRAHVKFLASDLLEGRAPGARGGLLATEYMATQFALLGARPAGDNGTYLQRVPLVGLAPQPDSTLSIQGGGQTLDLRWLDEFIGNNYALRPRDDFEAEAVFVGHGISAPEFRWDDFKGVDVRGKVLVLFTNEPTSDDPKFFDGKALTYYGRWTYKYEEATRRGARGVLIIHTTPTAGYGWNVVRNSWGRENPYVQLQPGEHALSLAGWVTQDAGNRLLALAGHSVDELLRASESRDFRPIPLNLHVRASMVSKLREIDTANVVAMIPGSDPELKNEAVLFSAHWDHLGVGTPVNGDSIYNGAMDNATGCAVLLEMARAWAGLDQKPKRSAIFVAMTSEEGGLRGSEYYAKHPLIPAAKTRVAMNFDGFLPIGRTRSLSVTGAERAAIYPLVEEAARRLQYQIEPEAHPEQGSFFRSDHFPLSQAGIPAFSVSEGLDVMGKPKDFGEKVFEDFLEKHYHQPSDEYRDDWDFGGMEQIARFGLLLGTTVANH